MIFVFLFLAFVRALGGTSFPVSTNNVYDLVCSRDDSAADGSGRDLRTAYGIVWSCLVTIFACVWTSGHPNIAGSRDGSWTCLKRRITMTIYALIAPEIMTYWAIKQHIMAKEIANRYNRDIATEELPVRSMYEAIQDWWTELPESAGRRGPGQPWTKTHGFFIQMGGFLLYENEYPKRALNYADMASLIRQNKIDAPTVTEAELKDRSKGDGISKAFVVLQTTWFVIQCVARLRNHLPLTELEVVTLAFAMLNAVIYAVWWNKPQDVGVAISVPLKAREDLEVSPKRREEYCESVPLGWTAGHLPQLANGLSGNSTNTQYQGPHNMQSFEGWSRPRLARLLERFITVNRTPTNGPKTSNSRETWLRRQLVKDREAHHWLLFSLFRVPYRCIQAMLRPLGKMSDDLDGSIPAGSHRVPMFHADCQEITMAWYASLLIGIVFGAVHLLAWPNTFPSHAEQRLWRVCGLIMTAVPALLLSTHIIQSHYNRIWGGTNLAKTLAVVANVSIPIYIVARFALLVIAILSLRELPSNAYLTSTISWTSLIPHL